MRISLPLALLGLLAAIAPAQDAPRKALAFGDSNTIGHPLKVEQAWPAQLQSLLKNTQLINAGVSGRTVGQEKDKLNGLDSIEATLKDAGTVSEVILILGTNDSKGRNWSSGGGAEGVARRMAKLIDRVLQESGPDGKPARITLVVPPPVASKLADWADKDDMFRGSNQRIEQLVPLYRALALHNQLRFVNLFEALKTDMDTLADPDGVHFTAEGQKRIAAEIARVLDDHDAPEPPADVKFEGQKVSWTASPSKDVLGYEVYDGTTLLAAVMGTSVELPEGHTTATVRARDFAGNLSK